MQYQQWLESWHENYVMPSSKERTYTRYGEAIRNHITPRIGEKELSELTPYVLQCFVTELLRSGNLKTGKGLSPSTVNVIITIIQTSLRTAYEVGLAAEYTADKIKRPKTQEKQIECFTLTEQKQIERYIIDNEKNKLYGVIICLYTGLRLGELLALEWDDIDFSNAQMHITKACHDSKDENGVYGRVTHTPKTQSSVRTIPIPHKLLSMLAKMKRKSRSAKIVSNGEKEVAYRVYQKNFETVLRKLNIPHRGFHTLRHTFATRAIECGMDVKTLSELLGHKNSAVTLNRYAHSLMDHKREMMNILGKLL